VARGSQDSPNYSAATELSRYVRSTQYPQIYNALRVTILQVEPYGHTKEPGLAQRRLLHDLSLSRHVPEGTCDLARFVTLRRSR
jgi:hypothetical protein